MKKTIEYSGSLTFGNAVDIYQCVIDVGHFSKKSMQAYNYTSGVCLSMTNRVYEILKGPIGSSAEERMSDMMENSVRDEMASVSRDPLVKAALLRRANAYSGTTLEDVEEAMMDEMFAWKMPCGIGPVRVPFAQDVDLGIERDGGLYRVRFEAYSSRELRNMEKRFYEALSD